MKPNNWGDTPTPRFMHDVRTMLGGGLTFKDNLNAAIITFDAKHATENQVANPLATKPIAFIPCVAMSITTFAGQGDGSQREFSAYPQLNTTRADGMLGITTKFTSGTWGRVTGILVGG